MFRNPSRKTMSVLHQILFFGILCNAAFSARILGIFHSNAYSHQQVGSKILHELAARGHEVVGIVPSAFALEIPIKNYKEVKLELKNIIEASTPDLYKEGERYLFDKILQIDKVGVLFSEMFFNQTSVQNLLKSNQKFDLVIIEQFVNEAFKGFCYHYKAPCIVVSSLGSSKWTDLQMGNPINPSYMPDLFLTYSSNMNFCERLISTFTFMFANIYFYLFTLPKHNELVQKYFPGAPHILDLYYNTSLMLLNSHVSIGSAVPLVPNMIEIGGYHVNPPKALPKDLQDYLDDAKSGVIYFSMGSNLKSKYMEESKRNAIFKVFSKLKQKVLWKWEGETLSSQPKNVKVEKWIPQQDVLAHPNVKLFITHGGLLSIIETLYHGVPIVGIPIFGDQQFNVANAERSGYGKEVKYQTLTEESFENAINEVLNNPKYTETAKLKSRILHDQPMKPLDKAMFWIEYVLRHKGAPQLRTGALNLYWFQVHCLDLVAFVTLIIFIFMFAIRKIIKVFCRRQPKQLKLKNQTKKNN